MLLYTTYVWSPSKRSALRAKGWRMLHSAHDYRRKLEAPFALDSGAWSAHLAEREFDAEAYRESVARFGAQADWIVLPDVVQGGVASLDLSLSWLDDIVSVAPVLIAVQDGMTPALLAPHVNDRVGIFVGGSTDWKIRTLPGWGELCERSGCWFHVGRVNSALRIDQARSAGARSIDGSGVSRWFSETRRRGQEQEQIMRGALDQLHLWGDNECPDK